MTVGVALIGSGIFAKTEHLPAILAAPSLSLKAVYSRSLASAQSLLSGTPSLPDISLYSSDGDASTSYDALLARTDIQAVIIALPITAQPPFILSALAAHKHVLSEKPIAKDVATARSLLQKYHSLPSHSSTTAAPAAHHPPTWAVAENYRFHPPLLFAQSAIRSLGPILSIHVRISSLVLPGGDYFETPWRKEPAYQGGFLLDGGVHYVAALRFLLFASASASAASTSMAETSGRAEKSDAPDEVVTVSALTRQTRAWLPPIDTVDAVWKSRRGAQGGFAVSFGSSHRGYEYVVACEGGVVKIGKDVVSVTRKHGDGHGKEEEETREERFEWDSGVKPEVRAWGEALEGGLNGEGERKGVNGEGKGKGKVVIDERQRPEEALRDLELLEAMIQSGEKGGEVVTLNGTS